MVFATGRPAETRTESPEHQRDVPTRVCAGHIACDLNYQSL
jgi:hypothetical protein